MRRTILMIAAIVLTITCGLLLPLAASQSQDALVRKGQQLYSTQKCAMCHSIAGKGNPKGPLDHVGTKWTGDELREWIVNWKAMAAKHQATRKPPMLDYSKLPKADVEALVAYLQTLK